MSKKRAQQEYRSEGLRISGENFTAYDHIKTLPIYAVKNISTAAAEKEWKNEAGAYSPFLSDFVAVKINPGRPSPFSRLRFCFSWF